MITIHPRQEPNARTGCGEMNPGASSPALSSFRRSGDSVLCGIRTATMNPGEGDPARWDDNMEILTCVRQGILSHCDSLGNEAQVTTGELQLLSAGTGVTHGEYNRESDILEYVQVWLHPDTRNSEPGYQCGRLANCHGLTLIASPDGAAGSLRIRQAVHLWWGRLEDDQPLTTTLHGTAAWLQLMKGTLVINDVRLPAGAGADITLESTLTLHAHGSAEFLLLDLT